MKCLCCGWETTNRKYMKIHLEDLHEVPQPFIDMFFRQEDKK